MNGTLNCYFKILIRSNKSIFGYKKTVQPQILFIFIYNSIVTMEMRFLNSRYHVYTRSYQSIELQSSWATIILITKKEICETKNFEIYQRERERKGKCGDEEM